MRGRPPDRPGIPPPRGGGPGEGGDRPGGSPGLGRRILGSGTAREILAKLVRGDPLGLVGRCRLHILDQALLVDPTRLSVKTFARAAYVAALRGYHGKPALDVWLDQRMTEALEELWLDDAEQEMQGTPPSEVDQPFLETVAHLTEVENELARRLCLVFNRLPLAQRRPFFLVAIDGRSFEQAALALDRPVDELTQEVDETYRYVVRLARDLRDSTEGELP